MTDTQKPFRHGSSTGYSYHKCRCEECVTWKRENRKQYRASGQEAAQQRAYRERNAEKVREWERAAAERRKNDPERHKAYLEYQKQYAAANAERKREMAREWREADPHRNWVTAFCANCLFKEAPVDDKTRAWMETLREENPPCTYCGGQWETLDHIIPISKGGDSSRKNLTPCCHPCNRSKHALDPYVWAARLAARRALPSPVET